MKPLAVVIVTHNRLDKLLATLQALRSGRSLDFDIFVLDNASTDGTAARLAAHDDVTVIHSEQNLGGAGGFETVLREVHDRGYGWFWCLDDDSAPQPDTLDTLRDEMAAHREDVILGCTILSDRGGEEPFWFPLGPYDPARRSVRRGRPVERMGALDSSCEVTVVPQAGMFFSRAVLDRIGFPDGSLYFLYEDNEYCFRAWRAGIPVRLVPGARLRHPPLRVKRSWIGWKAWRTVLHHRGRYYYLARNRLYVDRRYLRMPEYLLTIGEVLYDTLVHAWVQRDARYLTDLVQAAFDAARGRLGPRSG